jgi:hypothetical protein
MKRKFILFLVYFVALFAGNYFIFGHELRETLVTSILTAAALTAMDNFLNKITMKLVTAALKKYVKTN